MDFEEVLRRRRMVRRYTDQPISDDDVECLVNAALRAPTAGFTQGQRLLVLREEDDRRRLWATTEFVPPDRDHAQRALWLLEAPLLILPMCSEQAYVERYSRPDKTWTKPLGAGTEMPYWYVDTGFAALLILLEAVNLGLGALFMGVTPGFVTRFRAEFGVPGEFEPIGIVLVGHRHPDVGTNYRRDLRKSKEEMVYYGRWP